MHIEITIHCPELAQLAAALQAKTPAPAVTADPAPAAPTTTPPPSAVPTVPPAPVPTAAPTAAPAPIAAPTAAPSYTLGQLTKAGADLAQAGKMDQLLALLTQYGVQAVTQIPAEQYGAFALALRGLGAAL